MFAAPQLLNVTRQFYDRALTKGKGAVPMESRRSSIAKALEAYKTRGDTRTETVEFRGQLVPFEVIRISPNTPLLNHNNSRLRAQLLAHPDRQSVLHDPSSDSAQEILASLLAKTEKFAELKDQLSAGQRHPGVITRDGMLVNGNTRLVALREISSPAMDVAVLPEDANSEDFLNIELSLQMKNYVQQDYTYTNRLLLHRNLSDHYENPVAIFEALGWQKRGAERLEESLRRLALIEEIMETTGHDYSFFDSKEEMIKDLDKAYQQRLLEDPADAEQLKWIRVMALGLGLSKDEVRIIGSDFIDKHLLKRVGEDPAGDFLKSFKSKKESDGLDDLIGPEQSESDLDIRRIVSSITRRKVENNTSSQSVEDVLGSLYKESKAAAQGLIQEVIAENLRVTPIQNLRDMTEKIQSLTEELPLIFSDEEFDQSKFVYQARKTQKALQELQSELNRQIQRSEN